MADLKAQLELTADASGVEAGVSKAKRSIKSLGDASSEASTKASASIDRYVKKLETQNATMGKSVRETELYKLALRGASDAQLKAADSALKYRESMERQEVTAGKIKAGAALIATAAVAAGTGLLVMARNAINSIDALNDVADATGSSIENISALEDVALRTGSNLDNVSSILIKFNEALKESDPNSNTAKALKQIGLDADQLKKIDPAEALRQTAVALSNYADDGDKARLVQELFGKSVKDTAPFLKDLAEQGQLNAKVTTDQAEAAEKYNKMMAGLSTNIEQVSRSIISSLVPALNEAFDRFNRAREAGQSFVQSLMNGLGRDGGVSANPYQALQEANAEIARIEGLKPGRRSSEITDRQRRLEEAQTKARIAQSYIDQWEGSLNAAPDVAQASVGPMAAKGAKEKKGKAGKTDLEKRNEIMAKQDIDFLTEVQEVYDRSLESAEQLKLKNHEAAESYRDILDPTREIGREIERINSLVQLGKEKGGLTPEEGAAAEIAILKDAYKELGDEISASGEIYKNLIENIQSELGDGLYSAMKGNFDNIGDAFLDMLLKMAADAAAANITKGLFGDGSSGSGWVGTALSAFSGTVAHTGGIIGSDSLPVRTVPRYHTGGIAGDEVPAILQRGEGVFTKEQMKRLAPVEQTGGASINYAPVIQIDSRADRQQVMQDVQKAVRQGNAELVEKLQRQGRLA